MPYEGKDTLGRGPLKCLKCKIFFTNQKQMTKHLFGTAYYSLDHPDDPGYEGTKGTTWFHRVVDADGDYVMEHKRTLN